jgi:hypothetical protein
MSQYPYENQSFNGYGTFTGVPDYTSSDQYHLQTNYADNYLAPHSHNDNYYDNSTEYRGRSYGDSYASTRRAHSSGHGERDSYYRGEYSDYSPSSRYGQRGYYDDDSYYSDGNDRPRQGYNESGTRESIGDFGLGGIAAALTRRNRSKSRHRRNSDSYYNRSRSHEDLKKWKHAATAAVFTGVIEAVRNCNEPGGWTGEKGKRIATAALSAAGVNTFLDKDPDHKPKRHIAESVVGGLGINRIANGPIDNDEFRGRSRSVSQTIPSIVIDRVRSRSRSIFHREQSSDLEPGTSSIDTLKGVATIGGVAAIGGATVIGKSIYDRIRNKSRGRLHGSRSRSVSSDDSYVPIRRQRYGKRKSGYQETRDFYAHDNNYDSNFSVSSDDYDRKREVKLDSDGEFAGIGTGTGTGTGTGNESAAMTAAELENIHNKTRQKELMTVAFGSIATASAARGIYNTYSAARTRHRLAQEGKLNSEEARKAKRKILLQDAAAVGISALSLKSAYGEWKGVRRLNKEKHELEDRKYRHSRREKRHTTMQPTDQQQWPGFDASRPTYDGGNPYRSW